MRIRVLQGALALLLSGQTALFVSMPAWAATEQATSRAVEWFLRHKAPDGALPSYENGYTVGGTADGVLALAAADEDPGRFGRSSGETPEEYLRAHAADDTAGNDPRDDAHLAGKVALAVAVAGKDPHRFGRADLVGFIQSRYDPSTGGYRGSFKNFEITPLGQGLAVLGLIASGEPVPFKAVDYLLSSQAADGGWDSSGYGTDVQTSSIALQALVATANAFGEMPGFGDALAKSMEFFRAEQNEDGGFSYKKAYAGNFCSGARPSEVDSTGLAIQAIRAMGQDPAGPAWTRSGANPKQFLESVQNREGSFSFQEGPDCNGNGGSTYAAVLGLQETSFVCLMDLGTCRPRQISGRGRSAASAPLPGEALTAGNAAETPPARGAPSAGGKPQRARRPVTQSANRPAGEPGPGTAAEPPTPCGPADCSTASAFPTPAASGMAAPELSAGPRARSKSFEERVSGRGSSRDPVVWLGLAVIALLSASIGRRLLKGRK